MIPWAGRLDPAEELDFIMDFGGGSDPLLEAGEKIASYSLAVTATAAALGLEIMSGGSYSPWLSADGTQINLWLRIHPDFHDADVFRNGVFLNIEVTLTTTSVPPRKRQRTFGVQVRQL